MTTHSIDLTHSYIGFSVRHMMFAKVRGQFKTWTATLSYEDSDPAKSVVTVDIDTASIETREAQRDAHLRSADFFDAANFPKMTFKSKRIKALSDGRYEIVGDLTIRGTTNEVKLDVERSGAGKDPWGNERLGFTAKGTISRGAWGLKWNQALEAGGVLVSDNVELDVEVQIVAKSETIAA
jgi:polyisoprenoid-binding protein YceI